jgi:uridine kinase
VDGVTASGKSTLARELTAARLYLAEVEPARRATIVVEHDDLYNPCLRIEWEEPHADARSARARPRSVPGIRVR